MILLFDIGNTHTHLGLANRSRVFKQTNIPTASWARGDAEKLVRKFVGRAFVEGAALCSVVPRATPFARTLVKRNWRVNVLELTPKTLKGVGIDYPKPARTGWRMPPR
jgi:pantothenate kinase type III